MLIAASRTKAIALHRDLIKRFLLVIPAPRADTIAAIIATIIPAPARACWRSLFSRASRAFFCASVSINPSFTGDPSLSRVCKRNVPIIKSKTSSTAFPSVAIYLCNFYANNKKPENMRFSGLMPFRILSPVQNITDWATE